MHHVLLSETAGAPPIWTVFPFAIYLLAVAILPLVASHWWEHNRNKLIVAILASIPVVVFLIFFQEHGGHWLIHSAEEYIAFIALLASLFIISGGVYLKGSLAGTPPVNTVLLLIGTLLASFIGTTGASMLLIRPLLRANEKRQRKVHLVIFFIFTVSNAGGMLTPLGDPPLFLGYLRGVPFTWTFRLFLPWGLVNAILLLLFYIVDQYLMNKEKARPAAQLEEMQHGKEPLGIQGGWNFLWLLGVLAVIFIMGTWGEQISKNAFVRLVLQVTGMLAMAVASMVTTKKQVRDANRFTWVPIIEVAFVFIGIFITMVPALKVLEAEGANLGVNKPWQFFWATGILSSFLDNAPTYLTFATLAVGVVNQNLGQAEMISADNLSGLVAHPMGNAFLTAIACSAVFMGANTYIGNGPNFMVKAIAEENKVKMPSFFGYMLWSVGILVPLFILVTFLFFMGDPKTA